VAGLENCEAIINEPGIHGVLLGPGDLSFSHGWPMSDMWSRAPFREAVTRVADACTAAGKVAATLMGGDDAKRALDAGYRMVGLAADAVAIRSAMAANFNADSMKLRGN
jgi:4-hydroxy-2-oxoheptanedioate aldolase